MGIVIQSMCTHSTQYGHNHLWLPMSMDKEATTMTAVASWRRDSGW